MALLSIALAVPLPAMAENAPPAAVPVPAVPQVPLTLERVFASPDLAGTSPRGARLSPDGTLLTLLRNRADDKDRYDLWALDIAAGSWRMLVDSAQVGSGAELSEAEKMQRERARIGSLKGIVAYDWSPDGKSILVPLDGDLYLAALDGSVRRLTATEASELNPTISERGGSVAFVRDRRLWVAPIGGEARAITPAEPSETVHWGEAEFVAQEEMDRSTGYWWSPDDTRIAVERFDEAPVGVVTRAAIGAEGTRTFEQRYPAAGTPNVAVALYVVDPAGGAPVAVDLGADPDIYLARVDWAPDGKTLYVQRQNRDQTRLDMLAVDPGTGKSRVLFTERAGAKSWINLTDNYKFLADGSLIWWSERDGYGHLYRFGGGKWTQLTKGDWVVTALDGVDEKTGRVFFEGRRDTVLENHVYALDLAHPGKIERLTERGFTNAASMDKAASRLIVRRSSATQPGQVYLADARGTRTAWIAENRLDADHPYAPYLASHAVPTFGTLTTADGATLHWEMLSPPRVPGKRYPVFFQHYGGPHAQTVAQGWTGALAQYIVDRGYIFFQIDNRGSANRGTAFEDPIWRAMGDVEVADQRAGAEWLKARDFVDPARIATYGWSYGGYMTLKMLEADQGLYAAGIAGAPVTKWELYDTHYTERYMGDPRTVPDAYARADALAAADRIADPLLLIHGMSDDNVVFENSTALAARMQGAAVPFEMMFYPGRTHSFGGGKPSEHVWQTIFAFLERHGVDGEAR